MSRKPITPLHPAPAEPEAHEEPVQAQAVTAQEVEVLVVVLAFTDGTTAQLIGTNFTSDVNDYVVVDVQGWTHGFPRDKVRSFRWIKQRGTPAELGLGG